MWPLLVPPSATQESEGTLSGECGRTLRFSSAFLEKRRKFAPLAAHVGSRRLCEVELRGRRTYFEISCKQPKLDSSRMLVARNIAS